MKMEELIQSPDYWRELYENECWRLGIEPNKVLFSYREVDTQFKDKKS